VMLEPTPSEGVVETIGGSEGPTMPSRPTAPDGTTEPEQPGDSTEPEPTSDPTEPEQTTESPTATNSPHETTAPYSHPTAAATGIADIGGVDGGTPGNPRMEAPLLWLLGAVCALLAVLLQWRIRVAVTNWRCSHGQPNRQALRLWKQLAHTSKLLRQPPAEEAFRLAQKARFSQHTLTAEELRTMKQALTEAHRLLRKRNLLLQPVYTLILAVY